MAQQKTPENKDDDDLKPGSSAPLRGALGNEVCGLLGLAYTAVPLAMAQQVTHELGMQMKNHGPLLGTGGAKPATPNPFEMKMPELRPPGKQ